MHRLLTTIVCLLFFQTTFADCNDDAERARLSGQVDQSIEILNECLERELGRVARTYLLLGLANVEKTDHDTAISFYSKAIDTLPDYAIAYANRGVSHSALGDNAAAITDLDKAIELDPASMMSWYYRATVWEKLDRPEKAIEDYSQALTLPADDRNRSLVFYRRGMLYVDRRANDKALEDFNNAVAMAPQFAKAYFSRARLQNKTGDRDAALADFTRVVELEPENAAAYYQRAGIYKKKKLDHLAIRDYDKAMEIKPNLKTYANRSLIYLWPILPVLIVLLL